MTKAAVFVAVIVVLLVIAAYAARNARSKESLLVADGNVSTAANGLAITGEFASVATFLGLVGGVSLGGFNGIVSVLGVPLGFLLLLIVVAEPLRRAGHFTVGDMFARRMPSVRLRVLLGVTGLVISAVYMVGQFVGAGSVIGSFFGLSYPSSIVIIGVLTLVLVLLGGMTSATAVQVVKTVLLLAASVAVALLALHKSGWNPFDLMSTGVDKYGQSAVSPLHGNFVRSFDNFSAVMAEVFGVAGMPHIMVRLLTVRNAGAARRSALVAIWVMSCYLVVMVFVGYAAANVVGRPAIALKNPSGSTATVQLAGALGGETLAAIVVGLVFAIIAAVLAGLLVAMMGIISHDIYGETVSRTASGERASARRQVVVARLGAIGVAVLVSALALGARTANLVFVGTFAFGVAGSTIFPVVLLSLYWRRFNLSGAISAISVGLGASIVALVAGPNLLGADAPLPFSQPAALTIPLGFLAGWAGTWLVSRSSRRVGAVPVVGASS